MKIEWRQNTDVRGRSLDPESYRGFIGDAEIASIRLETHENSGATFWCCVFYAERAHYFRDTLQDAMITTQEYWDDYYMRLHSASGEDKIEDAKNRMWH